MSTEIEGSVGPIKGKYKKESSVPIIINPCQHLVIQKNRKINPDLLLMVHGRDNGKNEIIEHEIGK